MIKYFLAHLLIFFVTLFSCQLLASPQMPDYIIFKGDTIVTYNLILEKYLQIHDTSKTEQLFGLSFRKSVNGGFSSNCWRGYQAIYEIDNDSFFLVDIINCGERRNGKIDKPASIEKMKSIFGDLLIDDRVFIDWFSGVLNFPLSNNVLRWDGVFYKIYEKETVVEIVFGKVFNVEIVDNYVHIPNGINRMNKEKLSDILFEKIKKEKWINSDSIHCSGKYLVKIGRDGKVSKVTMRDYQSQDSVDKYWERDKYNYCINTILHSLKKLQFDLIKDKGKLISEDVYIEISFYGKDGKMENLTHL